MQITDIPIDRNHRETTLHGTYEFPIAVYLDQLDRNSLGFVNWHWHDEIQFSLVTKGEVEFMVNQRAYRLKAGQGLFINSGYLHMSRPVSQPDSTYICIDADIKLLSFFHGSAVEQNYIKPFLKLNGFSEVIMDGEAEWHKDVQAKIIDIYEHYTKKTFGYELDICMLLAAIWKALISNQSDRPEATTHEYSDQQRIKIIMSYIHEHYMEKITLQELATIVHISNGECCRFFKRIAKCTVFDYIKNYRVNKSIELLRTTEMTISQIGDSVGFGSTSYYIETFKKYVSCTPREYRMSKLRLSK